MRDNLNNLWNKLKNIGNGLKGLDSPDFGPILEKLYQEWRSHSYSRRGPEGLKNHGVVKPSPHRRKQESVLDISHPKTPDEH